MVLDYRRQLTRFAAFVVRQLGCRRYRGGREAVAFVLHPVCDGLKPGGSIIGPQVLFQAATRI
jgi:hypothetical protein